jgi:peptidyl-prolyl cis-trans isomerase D
MAVAAKKAHLNFIHIPAVDAKGNDPDGKKVLPSDSEALLGAIAKAEIGDEGDTFPTPDLHYFAIRVNGVTPPRLKNFDTVRADALKAWTADKRLALLKAKAQALTAKANKEHSLAAAAAAAAAPVQSSPALKRQTDEGLFKANVVTAIFAAKPGGAVSAPIEGGGIMIARVTGIAHPPPTPGDMQFLQGAQEISRSIGSDLLRLLAKAVQAKQGFTVNQRLIDQTVSGSGGQ